MHLGATVPVATIKGSSGLPSAIRTSTVGQVCSSAIVGVLYTKDNQKMLNAKVQEIKNFYGAN